MRSYISKSFIKLQDSIVVFGITFLSFFSFYYFYSKGQHLLYGDALSRLNISRKIIDNLTPGLAQLGNVWLPLPQVLMLPFIWNNYLWHTGMAGAIISMLSFMVGGVFLYKSAKILSGSYFASLFSVAIYALNINLLYLQTTAMSEAIFLCTIILAIYNFIQWIRNNNDIQYLFYAAISMSSATLIRYEALAFLFSSVPMIFFYSWIKSHKYKKAEGTVILYLFLAGLRFLIWTIYLAAIFGDPLYWKNYYTGTHVVGDSKTQLHIFTQHINFIQALWKYFTSIVWMNGLIPTIFAIISLPILIVHSIKNRIFYFIPLLAALSMFAFMILTLQRNTPIDQPNLTIQALSSGKTSYFLEFNIRYGLLMLPIISFLSLYLFRIKFIPLRMLLMLFFCIQLYSYIYPTYSVIFQLPISIKDNITQGTSKEKDMTIWLKKHYDNGLIMISALKHDPQMLQLGLNYRNYIHEGAGRYWIESKKDPQRYASWIVFDSYNKDDQVTKFLGKSPALSLYYNLVYQNDGIVIYKIKTKPDIII